MEVNAKLVKKVRDAAGGAPLMKCREALEDAIKELQSDDENAVIEKAIEILRVKGVASASKKADREAKEGLVSIKVSADGSSATMVALNCETDFVAKNEVFQQLIRDITEVAFANKSDAESILQEEFSGKQVDILIKEHIASLGENIKLASVEHLSVENGVVAPYIHNAMGEMVGKIGVLVAMETDVANEDATDLAKKVAMHVAAARPIALREQDISSELIAKERQLIEENARESGKPEAALTKIVEGREKKFIAENALLEQAIIFDEKQTVNNYVASVAKENNMNANIVNFKLCVAVG
jgi:elongation factor Ts